MEDDIDLSCRNTVYDTSSLVQSFLCMMHLLLSNHLYTKGPIYGSGCLSLITIDLIDVTLADEDNNSMPKGQS